MEITLISVNDVVYDYGFRSLSAFMKKNNYQTNLVFLNIENKELSGDIIWETLEICSNSILIGVSLLTHGFPKAVTITRFLKKFYPNIPVIWGGIHPSGAPYECIEFADMVCLGEGEGTLLEVANKMSKGEPLDHVNNIFYKNKDGNHIKNTVRPLIYDMDSLPFQDYSLDSDYVTINNKLVKLDDALLKSVNLYYPFGGMGYVYVTMTSRGCPFNCTFCCNNVFRNIYAGKGKFVRKRSIENIINEVKSAKKRLPFISSILFDDSSFLHRSVEEIRDFSDIYKKEVDLPFGIEMNPVEASNEKIRLLKGAGLTLVHLGIQSGNEYIRKTIYKRNTPEEAILKANKILTDHKILHKCDLIIDTPFDNDSEASLRLIKKFKPYFSTNVYSLMVYPGAEIKSIIEELGYKEWISKIDRDRSYLEIVTDDAYALVLKLYQIFPPNKILFKIIHHVINTKPCLMVLKIAMVRKLLIFPFIVFNHIRFLLKRAQKKQL